MNISYVHRRPSISVILSVQAGGTHVRHGHDNDIQKNDLETKFFITIIYIFFNQKVSQPTNTNLLTNSFTYFV